MAVHVSIGQVKRDISDLVNRVAYQGEQIILTSRGRPKAVLISVEEYERLRKGSQEPFDMQSWLDETQALTEKILLRRGGALIDVAKLLNDNRADLEARGE
jgi:prevent-host-death family protein